MASDHNVMSVCDFIDGIMYVMFAMYVLSVRSVCMHVYLCHVEPFVGDTDAYPMHCIQSVRRR